MNKLILLLSLLTSVCFGLDAKSAEPIKLSEIYYGSEVIFNKRVDLVQGQEEIEFNGGKCTIYLETEVKGKRHIPKGTSLIVEEVRLKESHTYRNLGSSNNGLKTEPASIVIEFQDVKADIYCQSDEEFSNTIADLEQDGMLKVKLPAESEPFTFK